MAWRPDRDVTLRAVLEHSPRALRRYFEELAAQPETREPADTRKTT